MLIWNRWGILGVLIPLAFILITREVVVPAPPADSKPVNRAKGIGDTDESATAPQSEDSKAADREKEADHLKAVKRAKDNAFGIGSLLAAVVLWPLGRRLNRTESR